MNKNLGLLFILLLMFSVVSNVSAAQADTESLADKELLEKYAMDFKELENELKETVVLAKLHSKYDLDDKKIKEGIVFKEIEGEDGVVTLAIPYSTYALNGNEYEVTVTHAKLYTKSTWSEDDNDWGSLKSIQGRVLKLYDSATCTQIAVTAGQYSALTPINNRTENFVEYKGDYDREFDWPEIGLAPDQSDLGHTAYFTIVRGSKTEIWKVVCNKNERFHEKED